MEKEETPFTLDLASTDIYTLITLFINLLSLQAWRHMGLRLQPGTTEVKKDLERAQIAIDCVAFLIAKLEGHVQESEEKQLKNLLADLQINFVRIGKE